MVASINTDDWVTLQRLKAHVDAFSKRLAKVYKELMDVHANQMLEALQVWLAEFYARIQDAERRRFDQAYASEVLGAKKSVKMAADAHEK